jgi:hypothetical protein
MRPTHYGGEENPFKAIKIINHYELNFSKGNAIKYILRAGKKNNEIEDLVKAKTYIEFEIERLRKLAEKEVR